MERITYLFDMAAKILNPPKICANFLALKNKHCKIVFNFTTLKKCERRAKFKTFKAWSTLELRLET